MLIPAVVVLSFRTTRSALVTRHEPRTVEREV
jgi:hypothetical protein